MYKSRSGTQEMPLRDFSKRVTLMHRYLLFTLACIVGTSLQAQISRLGEDIQYQATASGQVGSGEHSPFWQTANKYGLGNTDNNSGYFRAAIQRNSETDSLRNWRIGYAADIVVPIGYSSKFITQQLYAEFAYQKLRLSVGQKERPAELKNNELSTGGMTLGTNARPLPQVRLETSDFFAIPGTKHWVHLKGHVAYGWYTDNKWQREFNAGNKLAVYTANSLYHSKAGYMRIGNPGKFPLTFTGGLEMACQFGGTVWNRHIPGSNPDGSYKFNNGIKEYLQAFIPSGSDVTDGDNPNVMGNTVGSYLARLDYKGKSWGASIYGEHFFEDHSMMGWDFDWKDFLWGAEITLPKNPFVSTIVAEHMRTTDQSGAVFKNMKSENLPYSVGGVDDYYNHGIYGAFQHAGFVMGTPLVISPIYNKDGKINCYDNRITSYHTGIKGAPHKDVSYRILYTHVKSWGSYKSPRPYIAQSDFLLAEVAYTPHSIQGLSVTASYGQDWGCLTGSNKGGMLTVSYSGWINHKK